MSLRKEIKHDNELYLYSNGKLIYKRWLNQGYSKVFDKMAYGKDTFVSIIEDDDGNIKHRRKIFINGEVCNSTEDFWNKYTDEIGSDAGKYFGRNLDALNDALYAEGPGFPGVCIIEIIGCQQLENVFGKDKFDILIELFQKADCVELIIDKERK